MHYVVLDLEWNTALDRNTGKYVNEIVEIGAVKLNDKYKEIDRFSCLIISKLTNHLSGRFKKLTGISNIDMHNGIPFESAIKEYQKWVGKNTVTLTWSNSDIYSLYDNYNTFLGVKGVPCIGKYVDLQKYAQAILLRNGREINNQISLSAAAEMFGIDYASLELHRAVDDGVLGAMILKECYDKHIFKEFIVDTTAKEYYQKLMFKPYIICDINSPKINKKALCFTCEICGKKADRVSNWRFKGHSFRSDFYCQNCKEGFIGCVSFKNYYDKVSVKKYRVKAKQQSETVQ